jgi:hypothetical protein
LLVIFLPLSAFPLTLDHFIAYTLRDSISQPHQTKRLLNLHFLPHASMLWMSLTISSPSIFQRHGQVERKNTVITKCAGCESLTVIPPQG